MGNTLNFTAMLLDCNRHSLVSGDRQIKVILIVTGGEIESEIVNAFCAKIKADENVKVSIVRESD